MDKNLLLNIINSTLCLVFVAYLVYRFIEYRKAVNADHRRTIVKAVFAGLTGNILAKVTSREPTKDEFQSIELQELVSKTQTWMVKSIERSSKWNDDFMVITFWNGTTVTVFDAMYIVEQEVSNG